VRHRVFAILALVLALVVIGGGVAWLVTRTHHGTGAPVTKAPQRGLRADTLCESCAQGFNPLGSPVDEAPHAALAIDNQLNTAWDTQHYYDNKLDKAGTGIYLNASPGVVARELHVADSTPGFTAVVYARNDSPPLKAPPGNGWTQVSSPMVLGKSGTVPLNTQGTPYHFYLVWITGIGGHQQLSINELTLYR
jgi:serine/threonine-protein kinase